MKKIPLLSLLLLLGMGIILTACHSEADETSADVVQMSAIIATMKAGTWHITNYVDHGVDKTSNFTDFEFTFDSGNALTATNGTNIYTGFWTVTNTPNDDQSPNNNIDFNITFSAPAHFEDITDDWDVVSRTETKIVLIDVGGSGSVDNLTFEKN